MLFVLFDAGQFFNKTSKQVDIILWTDDANYHTFIRRCTQYYILVEHFTSITMPKVNY